MLFLDLDNFKVINDSLGHDVGIACSTCAGWGCDEGQGYFFSRLLRADAATDLLSDGLQLGA